MHEIVTLMRHTPMPIVAAINGAAAGAGLGVALAADLRVGGPSTRFVTAFLKIALSPDTGTSFWLPRLIGPGLAAEFLMLSDPIDARRAHQFGLLNRLAEHDEDVLEEAVALAERLAAMPEHAIGRTKRLINASLLHSFEQHLQLEREYVTESSSDADFAVGVAAFAQKRPPQFNRN
jgi:2-(1,2-epoxy-1,2-dihydrophenyl)acetyl-CoA isomerase